MSTLKSAWNNRQENDPKLNYNKSIDEWLPLVPKEDRVNHPSHYTWLKDLCGIEVIDITRHLDFDLGNCLKYILRAGKKTENGLTTIDKQIEDLEKARFYLNDKIEMLKKEAKHEVQD